MNYTNYYFYCLITSLIMFVFLLSYFKKINICTFLIIAVILSIIWRSTKLIQGQALIEEKNNYLTNKLFILDFIFGFLSYICILSCNQINKKSRLLTFCIFILAWLLNLYKAYEVSRTIHLCGHIYVLIIFVLAFVLNLR